MKIMPIKKTKIFIIIGRVMILNAVSNNGNLKIKFIKGNYIANLNKKDLRNKFIQ